MRDNINIEGLDKAEILAALYNSARVQGFGALHADNKPMERDEAAELLKTETYFDYLKGRVMKVSIRPDAKELDPGLYDRDNGQGAAARIIERVRNK